MKKFLSVVLCFVMLLSMAACSTAQNTGSTTVTDGQTIGEGAKTFLLTITDGEGNVVNVTVNTDEETVGGALLALGLVAGETNEYGLYIKEVNGIIADFDADGTYWAFYINGEYAMTGVDATEITEGATYGLTLTKG